MRVFLYKLLNWLVGFGLFNLLCMGFALVLWYTFPGFDGLLDGGARKALVAWAVLNLFVPFDTIGFLNKLVSSLRSSFEWNTLSISLGKDGVGLELPWHPFPYREGSALSKAHHLGVFCFFCFVPLWAVHFLYPDLGVMDVPWGLVVLLAWTVITVFAGYDPFAALDMFIEKHEAEHPKHPTTDDQAA